MKRKYIVIIAIILMALITFLIISIKIRNTKIVNEYKNNFNTHKTEILNGITKEDFDSHIKFDLEDLQSIDTQVNSQTFKASDIENINNQIETETNEIKESITNEIKILIEEIDVIVSAMNKEYIDTEKEEKQELVNKYNTIKETATVSVIEKINKYNELVNIEKEITTFNNSVDERIADEKEKQEQENNRNSNNNTNNTNNSSNTNTDSDTQNQSMPDYCFATKEEAWEYGDMMITPDKNNNTPSGYGGYGIYPGCAGNGEWWEVYFY